MDRRDFIRASVASGTSLLALKPTGAMGAEGVNPPRNPQGTPATVPAADRPRLPDLAPAEWIWYPSGRTLQNTFVLFRREVELAAAPRRATGWIAADSRYRLEVNGRRIQWGPAPADPRWAEADPIDLTNVLVPGRNAIGSTVLYFGQGDGTWPIGRPGFLFWLEIEHADGRTERVVSNDQWSCLLSRAWPPGHYKRWFLRSLQEEFDARRYPYGWSSAAFKAGEDWLKPIVIGKSPNKPALANAYDDYQFGTGGGPADAELRPRTIPMLVESDVPAAKLSESLWLRWTRPAEDYFDFRTPDPFQVERSAVAVESEPGQWLVNLDGQRAAVLTFEFAEQVVGWPHFTIEAPAGTIVEMLVHEAHQLGGPPLLNTHFDAWTRFTCKDGVNDFETFDFESLRWLQLHIRGGAGPVKIRRVGALRRKFPWPQQPHVRCSEPALQRLFDASINTLHNCAQETLVDGMARERQQYSGDGAHQMHAVYYTFGESRLLARFVDTFSQGMTKDGYFLDCWPAYDRLARLMERQLDLTNWGPILDHGVEFNFDCWNYFLYTGNLKMLSEPYARLLRFADYLRSIITPDGLLPVENFGIPSVWIDHVAYREQRHKQCAFNLYAAAMLEHALAPLCTVFGDSASAAAARQTGRALHSASVARFWDPQRAVFVNNRPWLAAEKEPRLCDRSLATAILFDQCPKGQTQSAVKALAECPTEMGLSYPCNAGWRLWALAKEGRADVIVQDLRQRWATMDSVRLNNTLQEDWTAVPDSGQQWSHCAVVPLYVAFMSLAGIRPLEPAFQRVEVRPQLASLPDLDLRAHTVRGPIQFTASGASGNRELTLAFPPGCEAELVLPREESVNLPASPRETPAGWARYHVPEKSVTLRLKHI